MGTKIYNLINMTFGKLFVISKAEDYISPKGQHGSCWLEEDLIISIASLTRKEYHEGLN